MNQPHLEKLCHSTRQLVEDVASFIQDQLGKVNEQDIETKSLNSLVSYVDKKAEEKLVGGLKARLDGAVFLTEEETIEAEEGEYQWIIDPLDGTTNFLHQLPFFCISVALRHRDTIVMGIVFEVNRRECFYAWKNGGAWLNDKRIKVSPRTNFADTLLATGFPYYDYGNMEAYMKTFQELLPQTRGIRRFGSAALDLAYVACGRFDAYFEYSLHAWDVAAGILLVEEAGGKVSDFKGGDDCLFGKEMLAGTATSHKAVLNVIKTHFS